MRFWCSVLVVAVVGLGSTARANWADRLFDEKAYDFGNVPRGAKVHHEFVVTNRTSHLVHISDVHPSCSCTVPTIARQTLPPGAHTVVKAVMDTRNFVGDKSVTIYVSFDRPGLAEVRLVVTSHIRDDVTLAPGELDFGAVARGTDPSMPVTISYAKGRAAARVERIRCTNPAIKLKVQEPVDQGDQVSYDLMVTLKSAGLPVGPLKDEIQLITNDPAHTVIPLAVEAVLQPSLMITPQSVFFGDLRPDQQARAYVLLRAAKPFKVLKIASDTKSFRVQVPDRSQSIQTVTVICEPSAAEPGAVTAKFHVETDLDKDGSADFSAYANVVR